MSIERRRRDLCSMEVQNCFRNYCVDRLVLVFWPQNFLKSNSDKMSYSIGGKASEFHLPKIDTFLLLSFSKIILVENYIGHGWNALSYLTSYLTFS